MFKKILLGVLVIGLIVLIGTSFAQTSKDRYETYLEGIFSELLQPDGEIYASWVNGLKKEKSLIVKSISTKVEILQVVEERGEAFIQFDLTIYAYCKTSGGAKVTVITTKPGAAITNINPKTINDLNKFKAGKETTKTIDGWNGEQDT